MYPYYLHNVNKKSNKTCKPRQKPKSNSFQLQGHSQHPSENNGLLLPKYESERLPEPTGGSPDVVHLIKYASLVFR